VGKSAGKRPAHGPAAASPDPAGRDRQFPEIATDQGHEA